MNRMYRTVWNTAVEPPETMGQRVNRARSAGLIAASLLLAAGVALDAHAGTTGAVSNGVGETVIATSTTGTECTGTNAPAANTGASGSAMAIGCGAVANGSNAVAIGDGASVSVVGGVAIGAGSRATAQNSVALGAGSVANRMNAVSVGAAGAERQITNVAAGSQDTDAVNLSQLKQTNINVTANTAAIARNTGDIAIINDDLSKLDGRVTNLTQQVNAAGVGLVQQTLSTGLITVGGGTNGLAVDFTGSQGARTLTGIAAGAVDRMSVDAVNGSQLFMLRDEMQQQIASVNAQITNIDSRVTNAGANGDSPVASGTASGDNSVANGANSKASGENAAATGASSIASGDNSTANGANSIASGNNSTAMGRRARASGDNSVAIGADSIADRDNTVSMGSAGHERQISNVAAGTETTDAVNLGQMNDALKSAVGNLPAGMSAKDYTDQQINAVQHSLNDVAKNAYAGVAAAMAMPNMTPSQPGKTVVAAGAGSYKSGAALGAGATYRSRNSKWLVNGAVSSTSTGDVGVRAQVGYEY